MNTENKNKDGFAAGQEVSFDEMVIANKIRQEETSKAGKKPTSKAGK